MRAAMGGRVLGGGGFSLLQVVVYVEEDPERVAGSDSGYVLGLGFRRRQLGRTERVLASPVSIRPALGRGSEVCTHGKDVLQELVCDERDAELGRAPQHPRRSALEERAGAFFRDCGPDVSLQRVEGQTRGTDEWW